MSAAELSRPIGYNWLDVYTEVRKKMYDGQLFTQLVRDRHQFQLALPHELKRLALMSTEEFDEKFLNPYDVLATMAPLRGIAKKVLDEGGASLSGYAYTAYFYNDYKGQPLSFNERGKVWKQYLTTSQITRATAVNAIDGFLDLMRPLMYVGKWKMDAEEAFSPGRLWTYGAGRVITDMEANLSQVENRAPDNPLVTHYYNQMTRFPAKFVLDILPDVMPEEVQRFFGPRAAIADLVRKAYHIT